MPSDEPDSQHDQAITAEETESDENTTTRRSQTDEIFGDMAATVDWLRDRGFYEGQDEAHRIVPKRHPEFASVDIHRAVDHALAAEGIDELYTHQGEAIEYIQDGKNVVVATSTASGKTLSYAIPAVKRAVIDVKKTLYFAPQNVLLQDQEETVQDLAGNLGFVEQATVAWYDSEFTAVLNRC